MHREVPNMKLAENIKNRRQALKLSQEYVAEQLGVSRQAVSKWETGQSEPAASNLIRLADVFEISLSELVNPQKKEDQVLLDGERREKPQNPILRANLIRIAITAQAAFLFNCTQAVYQLRRPDSPDEDLNRGWLMFSLVLTALSSAWMAANHRYEPDLKRRRKNVKIELCYCCAQAFVGLLTIRFGMGLVGLALMLMVFLVYILYVNPRFMFRRLTRRGLSRR